MIGQLFFKSRECYETINKIAEQNNFVYDDDKENVQQQL